MVVPLHAESRSIGRISKTSVEALAKPSAEGRSVLWDTELKGFGIRVTASGRRTYVLRYRIGGRGAVQRCMTIGRHGSPWTAEQARRRAFELLAMVRTGVDPFREQQRANEAERNAGADRSARLFDVLAERWLDGHVRGQLKSEADIEGVVRRDLKPAFAGLAIDEITKAIVGEVIERIGLRSKSAANKAHKWLRQMCNWLIEKGVIEHSPLDRTSRPFEEASRDRVLGLLEIVVVWKAAEQLPKPFCDFYRLLILCGQRLREVANAPWSEFDLAVAEWLIPAARMKSGRTHLIPLSDEACALLNECGSRERLGDRPIFTTDGLVSIAGFSKMKEALDRAIANVLAAHAELADLLHGQFADWVVHDLRRSLASGCQAMGTDMVVTEALLSHVSGERGGIRKVYQLYDYFDEKAQALSEWGALVSKALMLWEKGQFTAIMDLDPLIQAKRKRRARRTAQAEKT